MSRLLETLEQRTLFSATLLDAYEINDSRQGAAAIEVGLLSDQRGAATATSDNDWYRFEASAGAFSATLSHPGLGGDLDFELYSESGTLLDGNWNNDADTADITAELSEDGTYYVFVYGDRSGGTYDLLTDFTPLNPAGSNNNGPAAGAADVFEDNDLRPDAAAIGGDILATGTDNDWYRLTAQGDVTLSYDPAEGPLAFEIWSTDGNLLAGSYGGSGTDTLPVNGEVFAYVFSLGGWQGNVYSITGAAGTTDSGGDDGNTGGGDTGGGDTGGTDTGGGDTGGPDIYEPNDTRADAVAITGDITATATNTDFYSLTADGSITLDYDPAEGRLGFEVYSTDGVLLDGAYGGSGSDTLSANGDVIAFVFTLTGAWAGNSYSITGATGATTNPGDGGGDTGGNDGGDTGSGDGGGDDGGSGDGGNGNDGDGGSGDGGNGGTLVRGEPDRYEDNDTIPTAAAVTGLIEATATDNDWYTFDSNGEIRLTYNVTDGPLGLEVYDLEGNFLDGSYEYNGVETAFAEGDVLVYVFSFGGNSRGNVYTLAGASGSGTGGGTNTGGTADDEYEDNDSSADAVFITGRITATVSDPADWFTANADGPIRLDYDPNDGPILLEVYGADGNLIGASNSGSGVETVFATGNVRVFVSPGYASNGEDYALTIGTGATDPGDGGNGDGDGDNDGGPLLVSPAFADVRGVIDTNSRNQVIEAFGTALAGYVDNTELATRSVYNEPGFAELFYDDLGASALRFDMFPHVLNNSDRLKPLDSEITDEIRLGADAEANIAMLEFDVWGVGHIGPVLEQAPDDFKLIGTLWTPPHWMKGQQVDWFTGEPVFYPDSPVPDWEVRYDTPGAPDLPYWKSDLTDDPFLKKNWQGNSIGGTLKTDADTLEQFGRYMVAYVKGMERAYGVPFYSVAIQNEPLAAQDSTYAGSYNSQVLDPARYALVSQTVRAAFDEWNAANPDDPILTKLHGAEQYGPGNLNSPWYQAGQHRYTEALGNSGVADAISIHGSELGVPVDLSGNTRSGEIAWDWFINGKSDGVEPTWDGVADYGLPLWMTEHSGEADAWLTSGGNGPEDGALALGIRVFDTLVSGDASMYLHWMTTSTGDQRLPVEGADLTSGVNSEQPKFAAFSQFSRHIRPGMQRLDVSSTDPQILLASFENAANGEIATIVINMKGESETLELTLPEAFDDDDTVTAYVSSQDQFHERLGRYDVTADDRVLVEVPAFGIMTLTGDSNPFV